MHGLHVYIRLREEARRFGVGLGAVCGTLWRRADAEVGEIRENARSFGPALGAVCGAFWWRAAAKMGGQREKARILCNRVHGQRYLSIASKSVQKTRKMEG